IAKLYLVNNHDKKGDPTYVNDNPDQFGRPGACTQANQQLLCSFGALNVGQTVDVIVGFKTSGMGSFNPDLEANTSGAAFTDPNRSHGDALIDPNFKGTSLITDKNFAGRFNITQGGIVSNFAKLNGQNKQNTAVGGLPIGTGATVLDGPTAQATCVDDATKNIV